MFHSFSVACPMNSVLSRGLLGSGAVWSSEKLVSYHNTIQRRNQKISASMFAAIKASNLAQ
jgi:roadblock/LC7 domain-containing protein